MVEYKLEPISKIWYDNLNAGKLTGLQCKACGHIEFPPVPVCNSCGQHDMEWVEVSGEGELVSYSFSPEGVPPYQTNPTMIGMLKLKEGVNFMSWIVDVGPEDEGWMFANLPLKVKAEIVKISDQHNLSYPVYRIVDQQALSQKASSASQTDAVCEDAAAKGINAEKYEKLMQIVADIAAVGRDAVSEASKFVTDLDYSSMRRAMLCAEIEDTFGVTIPQGKVKSWETVSELIAHLRDHLV